jgi:transcriptional regulator with XRE-family HTH domain
MSIFVAIRYHKRDLEELHMKDIYKEQYRQIGLKIAYYRKLRGLTQEELAEQVGVTPAFIGRLEAPNISKALSLDTLFDIAAALDVPPYKFLYFDDF